MFYQSIDVLSLFYRPKVFYRPKGWNLIVVYHQREGEGVCWWNGLSRRCCRRRLRPKEEWGVCLSPTESSPIVSNRPFNRLLPNRLLPNRRRRRRRRRHRKNRLEGLFCRRRSLKEFAVDDTKSSFTEGNISVSLRESSSPNRLQPIVFAMNSVVSYV